MRYREGLLMSIKTVTEKLDIYIKRRTTILEIDFVDSSIFE